MFGDASISIINPTSSAILSQNINQFNKPPGNIKNEVINGSSSDYF